MAQTAAQKAAAQKKADQALLAKAQEQLAKATASTSKASATGTIKSTDYAQRNAGFNATGTIKTPQQTATALKPIQAQIDKAAADAKEGAYFGAKVGTTGKTQGQLDAATGARETAKLIGGSVDPATGYVTKKGMVTIEDANGDGVPDDAPGVIPGSTGGNTFAPERTLASDTFKNTLALLFGPLEASQPWVSEMFGLVSGFYKSGSTIEEALNLGLYDAKAKGMAPAFTKRFDAVFKLQDRLNKGEAVQVPTIAEYVKSEQKLGDVFRAVGLGELATQEMAGKILGDANRSVSEATALISDVFGAIDNAPEVLKNDLKTYFPGADRTSIAKAILLGKEGALELTKKVKGIEQLSAAKSQGVSIDLATGSNLAAGGADYGTSLGKFATVKRLERGQMLGKMSGLDLTQQDAINAVFSQDVMAQDKINKIAEEEVNRFSGRSGRLASQNRSTAGLI
jgi:hypothetical protein